MSEVDNLPAWTGEPGNYEVWYLTLSDPDAGVAYWIRSTLHAPVTGPSEARVWFARFDRNRPERTLGLNRGYPIGELVMRSDRFDVRIGDSELRSGRLAGEVEGGGHAVRFDLGFDTGEATYRMLPDALYRGRVAPTKPFVPNPDTRFTGTIEVDGEAHALDGAPGQQAHLYGTRHAERWAWAHCNAFDDEPGTVLEALSAQGRRGPVRTPFTTFIGIRREGEWIRLNRVSRRRDWDLGTWRLDASTRRYRVTGRVTAPAGTLLHARYEDPDGSERHCHNCEVSTVRLALFERRPGGFEEIASLFGEGTAHAEWAGRTRAPGVDAEHVAVDDGRRSRPSG